MSSRCPFRFVDDLFLGARRIIHPMMDAFTADGVGERWVWDATGRINVLDREDDAMLDTLAASGMREVALGIESGSDRVLAAMDKRITAAMTLRVAERLMRRGVNVRGTSSSATPARPRRTCRPTLDHVRRLWDLSDRLPGGFRASAFEFRPYPGSPVWDQLVADGHDAAAMTTYADVDLTEQGADEAMRQRDEFAFSVGIQFAGTPLPELRVALARIAREQHARTTTAVA